MSEIREEELVDDVMAKVRGMEDLQVPEEILNQIQNLWLSKLSSKPDRKDIGQEIRTLRGEEEGDSSSSSMDDDDDEEEVVVIAESSKLKEAKVLLDPNAVRRALKNDGHDLHHSILEGPRPAAASIKCGPSSGPSFTSSLTPTVKKIRILKKRRRSDRIRGMCQLDGIDDSSDDEEEEEENEDEDDEDDDEDDDDDNDDENEEGEDEGGVEEEPLGSGDDISDEDPSDLFDTENVVVCQYDKITRARNKWRFHLKDGIMNLNGKDYVFQKANGDAEW